ncbi:nicotinic acid mononucleotide adenylyltransferase [Sphingorhabdus lutea]|uniref:Probable nicotinate-nucleotide adenylyltransferase n=2 Tax=Sphingorhabdus lutea TaxID=1913578 RepID=A0A1L3JD77_9SPHN|nr:nicotinic acid mononucleotide adenylyltransferase [Sphingorhabdus lutea]
MPIGVMGGSFNPAHGGHRSISLFAINSLQLDAMWWLVSPGNPLKLGKDMAPLSARMASAQQQSRNSRIVATSIEKQFGTRYTVDTLRKLVAKYPKEQFIWVMGADNLEQFHQWKSWRNIARILPIAVIARPSYTGGAMTSPAMAWFRPYVRRSSHRKNWTKWSLPALVILRYKDDPRSATQIRRANPHWFDAYAKKQIRDSLLHISQI